jgi:hypothetical protein
MPFVERGHLAPVLQSRRSNNQVIETNRVIVSNNGLQQRKTPAPVGSLRIESELPLGLVSHLLFDAILFVPIA